MPALADDTIMGIAGALAFASTDGEGPNARIAATHELQVAAVLLLVGVAARGGTGRATNAECDNFHV
jgi:hypothetical protein